MFPTSSPIKLIIAPEPVFDVIEVTSGTFFRFADFCFIFKDFIGPK